MKETSVGAAYYLDDRLSLAEGTSHFSISGLRRETNVEGFYVLAIRKTGYRECVFRFSERDRGAARSMLASLNLATRNTAAGS